MPIIKSTSEVDGEQVDIYIEVDEVPEIPDTESPYQDTRESFTTKSLKAVGDVF